MPGITVYYSECDTQPGSDEDEGAGQPLVSYDPRDPGSVRRAEAALVARFGRAAPPLSSELPRRPAPATRGSRSLPWLVASFGLLFGGPVSTERA